MSFILEWNTHLAQHSEQLQEDPEEGADMAAAHSHCTDQKENSHVHELQKRLPQPSDMPAASLLPSESYIQTRVSWGPENIQEREFWEM